MILKKLILIAATAALVTGALAQGGGFGQGRRGMGPGGDPVQMTGREDVQKDLALTDDQKTKLSELRDKAQQKRQEAFQAAREAAGDDREAMMKAMQTTMAKLTEENTAAVNAILTPEQSKRLKEIIVQFVGVRIVTTNKEVAKDLGITDEQKAKFDDLTKRQQTAMQEMFQKMQNGEIERSQMQETMTKNNKIMDDEINKVLTDAQKAKLKEMSGKPFVRVDPPSPGGGI